MAESRSERGKECNVMNKGQRYREKLKKQGKCRTCGNLNRGPRGLHEVLELLDRHGIVLMDSQFRCLVPEAAELVKGMQERCFVKVKYFVKQ